MDFLEYCEKHKILLAVYPPHSTHTLQPLDVGCFKPLSSAYTRELINYLHNSQGCVAIKKGDFFSLFWRAWTSSLTPSIILSSFEATGIQPFNPNVILDKYREPQETESNNSKSSPSCYSGDDWPKIHTLIRKTVKDEGAKEAQKLSASLHHITVQNELLHHEIRGLKEALMTKKKHTKKATALPLQQRQEYRGGAVLWSPRKIREARHRQRVFEREEQEEKLKKAELKELREANKLYKEKLAQEKRVAREEARVERERERAEKAAQKAAQREARNTAKAIQLSQKGKRKASSDSTPKNKRQKRAVGAAQGVDAVQAISCAPTVTTRRGRNVSVPARYK